MGALIVVAVLLGLSNAVLLVLLGLSRERAGMLNAALAKEYGRRDQAKAWGECPACGSWGCTKTFCGKEQPFDGCDPKGDHLHRACKTCGRRWVTPTENQIAS